MIFRRMIFWLFAILLIVSGCKKENHFTIKGKISHAGGDTIYLDELQVSTSKPVAKVKIGEEGEFELEGKTSIPTFYLLRLSNDNFITLLVDSVDQVFIEADAANFSKEYNIKGSLGSVQVKELNETLNRTEYRLDSLRSLITLSKNNPDYDRLLLQWNYEAEKLIIDQDKYSVDFVMKNPFSMASVYALYQKYKDGSYVIKDFQTMRTAASALNAIYPQSAMVKALYDNAVQLLRQQKVSQMQQMISESGINSPDIELPDANNQKITLSSLRGKVVLVHFWAAEDAGSRVLNPLLVDAYEKYHSKGFEIYQVNLGTSRTEWLNAIKEDQLTWINVGDLNGSVKARMSYNVQTIPSNYLLDKDGSIVSKNLSGPNLDNALAKLLK